jgi:hypothetical protein
MSKMGGVFFQLSRSELQVLWVSFNSGSFRAMRGETASLPELLPSAAELGHFAFACLLENLSRSIGAFVPPYMAA